MRFVVCEHTFAGDRAWYMPMLQTADFVAKKFGISRDAQDRYSLESQRRTAAAQAAGRFDAEIVPIATSMAVVDTDTKETSFKSITLARDEGNRPQTTLETLHGLEPLIEGGVITAGNASCLLRSTADKDRSEAPRAGHAALVRTANSLSSGPAA